MLLVVVIAFTMRGGPAPETKVAPPPPQPKVVEVPKTVTPTVTVQPQPTPEPKKPNVEIDDIRERIARREFDAVMKRVRDTGSDVIASRRAMDDFLRRYRSTQAGQEALAFAEKMAKVNARPADNPGSTQPGLKIEVFERPGDWDEIRNRDLRSQKKVKDLTLDKIDLHNRGAIEQSFGRPEFLGVVITGYIEIPADGEYTLGVSSDDASFLFIGDWRVVEHDGGHAQSENTGTVPLKKGKHRLRLDYSQGHGDAALQLFWAGPNIPHQIVPPNALSRDP